jgi:hypothetical protein
MRPFLVYDTPLSGAGFSRLALVQLGRDGDRHATETALQFVPASVNQLSQSCNTAARGLAH